MVPLEWLALLSLSLATPSIASAELRIDDPAYTQAQRLIEIEPGLALNLYCTGAGGTTVVLDSGLTDPTNVWGYVQAAMARSTRVCSYDRAGVGFSDPGRRPAHAVNMVDDLHRLLAAAAIKPPYVLVAHSSGALNARLYAYTYPDEVRAMVLVDPTVEDQADRYRRLDVRKLTAEQWDAETIEPGLKSRRACVEAAGTGIVAGTPLSEECGFPQYPQMGPAVQAATVKFQLKPAFQRAQLSEEENVFRASADQVRAARRSYAAMPLVVLSRSPWAMPKNATPERAALSNARYRLWLELHAEVAALSTEGRHVVVRDAGHAIQLEQPRAVIDAVLSVLGKPPVAGQ